MRNTVLILAGLLSLSACAEYRPSEAKCFNSFAETTSSDCHFELLTLIGVPNG